MVVGLVINGQFLHLKGNIGFIGGWCAHNGTRFGLAKVFRCGQKNRKTCQKVKIIVILTVALHQIVTCMLFL